MKPENLGQGAEDSARIETLKQQVLATIPLSTVQIDPAGKVIYGNSAYQNMLEYGDGELVGTSILNRVASEEASQDSRAVLDSFFPILGVEQRPKGVGMILVAITGIKTVEEQLRQSQKLEALGTRSGGIADDLNNILYPIFIHANLLLEKYDADSHV